jgi:hypothetical protein
MKHIVEDIKIPSEMRIEDVLKRREELGYLLDDIKGEISVLNDEILIKLNEKKLNGMIVEDFQISKARRFSFTETPLSYAKEMGAIKESIDNTKLKALATKGVEVPGMNLSEYVIVRKIEEKKEDL